MKMYLKCYVLLLFSHLLPLIKFPRRGSTFFYEIKCYPSNPVLKLFPYITSIMSDDISIGYGTRSRLIFNGDDRSYELFEVKFLGYLKIKKLDDVIKNLEEEQTDADIDENKNSRVFAELVQVLDDRSLSLIIRDCKDNGRKAIRTLRAHYLPKGKPRIITLYTQLTSMVKGQSETITDYLIRAETASAGLKDAGEIIQDNDFCTRRSETLSCTD